ncbi:TetR/AcrR family transcriptional regulator [Rhodococcus chondri]|uniref:TetR family transcriptional regulator n=1 Tax=Rhodococcus chondri TaxID=3065941 RepID=A0ABU7JU36_9NOCA|nr:TetR family transcriptional regulator [Rhodococcus sp. CC-R104]MEE2033536.1 TetR family transcriptional regulator [Rhodococcus sp. CC-R104]
MASDVRARIVGATLHLIGTDGIAAITNRRIASRAEVSLGSITYHFPSQSDLLKAALTTFVAEETDRLREIAESYRGQDLSITDAAQVTERVADDLAFTAERIAPFELYIQAGRDPDLRAAADECWTAYDSLTVAILAALGVPEAETIAPTLVATIAGLQLRRLSTGADPDLASSVLLLLHGMTASAPR